MPLNGNKFLFLFLKQKFWMNKKLKEEEEKQDINKWAHLPDEILELIMKRLCLRDYLALRTICSPWRTTVTKAIANKHCRPLPELPLIVLRSSEEQAHFSLRTERECFIYEIYKGKNITCHGSHEGWMIMSDNVKKDSLSIFFVNPVTNCCVSIASRLDFPSSSSPIQGKKPFIGKMVASSGPDCYKPGYYLAALFRDNCHIAFYKLFDNSWNLIEIEKDSGFHFMDLEIKGSKLYVKTEKHLDPSMLIYDLKDSGNGSPKPKVLDMVPPEISTPYVARIVDGHRHDSGYRFCSLAKHESLEQLFLIYTMCNVIYKPEIVGSWITAPEITAVEVFKLDMNKEPLEWIKCGSLDDNVIFVSGIKNMVMPRTALNSTDQEFIRENSVYYAASFNCPSDPWQGIRLGVKHLTDNSIKYFSVKKSNHSKVPYPFWFVPSI